MEGGSPVNSTLGSRVYGRIEEEAAKMPKK
jgi:hypothetical protein